MKKNITKREKIANSYMLGVGAAVAGETIANNCTVAGIMCICALLALFESTRYEKCEDEEVDKDFVLVCNIKLGWMLAIIAIYAIRFSF